VHSKKRKSDHQHFANSHHQQRRRPRDLDPSLTSQHRAVPTSPPSRDLEYYPAADEDDQVDSAAQPYLPVDDDDFPVIEPDADVGDRYEETPVYDNMAAEPNRVALARRGKLVTFYRNGDPHYKVTTSSTVECAAYKE